MSEPIQIICPVCSKVTHLFILKNLEKDVDMKDEDELKIAKNRYPPEMSKSTYDMISQKIRSNVSSGIITTISKIKSHRTGLFKEQCKLSGRIFKIFFYLFMDHEKKLGGFTFHIDREIENFDEYPQNFPQHTHTLDHNGVKTVVSFLTNNKQNMEFIVEGDFAMNVHLSPDLRFIPYNILLKANTKSQEKLKECCKELGQSLLNAGIDVQLRDQKNYLQIETFDQEKSDWVPAVVIHDETTDMTN